MMPLVDVPRSSPSGLPMAITSSPTVTMSESPSVADRRPEESILIKARSFRTSLPTTVALCFESSFKMTSTELAPSTTCRQVAM